MLENTASDQIFVWMRPMPVPVQAPPAGHDAARGGEALSTAPGKPGGGIRSFGVPEPHAATVLSRVARGNTIKIVSKTLSLQRPSQYKYSAHVTWLTRLVGVGVNYGGGDYRAS